MLHAALVLSSEVRVMQKHPGINVLLQAYAYIDSVDTSDAMTSEGFVGYFGHQVWRRWCLLSL